MGPVTVEMVGAVVVVLVLGAMADSLAARPERRMRTLGGENRVAAPRPGDPPGQGTSGQGTSGQGTSGRRYRNLGAAVWLRVRRGRDHPDGIPPVAVLAERCAALARAGVPVRRVWELLSGVLDPPVDPLPNGVPAPLTAPAPRPDSRATDEIRRVARQVLDMLDTGGDVAGGLLLAAEAADPSRGRNGHLHLRWLAAVWTVVDRTGAPLAEVLDGFAGGLRQEHAQLLDRATALAGPRATAQVLAVLPAAGMGLGYALGADPVTALVGTSAGRLLLLVGVTNWVVGRWWINRLIHRVLR